MIIILTQFGDRSTTPRKVKIQETLRREKVLDTKFIIKKD